MSYGNRTAPAARRSCKTPGVRARGAGQGGLLIAVGYARAPLAGDMEERLWAEPLAERLAHGVLTRWRVIATALTPIRVAVWAAGAWTGLPVREVRMRRAHRSLGVARSGLPRRRSQCR